MPARTTVICSMAKRGDLGMNLLETSNMLQMAGRAGRRGMDTAGACVIAATMFEGPDDAVTILTNEVKPVVSQFTPSYTLAINLVDRGLGKLDLARSMVEKSFGVWESKQRELDLKEAMVLIGDALPEEQFLNALQLTLEKELIELKDGTSSSQSKISKLASLVDVLSDGKKLKKVSKSYSGAASILDLEQSTLSYLEREYQALENDKDPDLPVGIVDADRNELLNEIKMQRQRVIKGEREVNNSLLSMIAKVANNRMRDESDGTLRKALAMTRLRREESPASLIEGAPLEPGELNAYIKATPKNNRKPIFDQTTAAQSDDNGDETWDQMTALLGVLQAYGCLTQSEINGGDEESVYKVTSGGEHVGNLGMENSLWVLSALGGAWDVAYESVELDKFQDPFNDSVDNDFDVKTDDASVDGEGITHMPKPQSEANTLTRELCDLNAGEIAGYISSLVVDAPRQANSVVESFQKLTHRQQRVVQGALLSLERLVEVQRIKGLDDSIGRCQLELSSCDVVTAWASGASWQEVLAMSGAAPGDLVSITCVMLGLSRAFWGLDALVSF
jgi:superfamily II RNA helicase